MFLADYIIPLYNSGDVDWKYRLSNINDILNVIPDNINILIVFQNPNNDIEFDPVERENLTVLNLTNYSGPFNKSWLYNHGVKNSVTNKIFLGESDVTMITHRYFEKVCPLFNRTWAIAWDKITYFDINGKPEKIMKPQPGKAEGGIVYFNKNYYMRIGGANEFYRDLGGIDNDIARRAEFKAGYNIIPSNINHLWHPKNNMKCNDWKYSKYRDINKGIYKFVRKSPENEIKRLRKYVHSIGDEEGPLVSRFKEYPHIRKG